MKELYYELTSDGYYIYDHDDPLFRVHQYEPYIPDPSKTYEENAIAQMAALTAEPEPAEQTYTLDEAAAILASEVNE